MRSKAPQWIAQHIAALLALCGVAGGGVYVADQHIEQAQRDEYVQAVAQDARTSLAVKIAMVMGRYYESSGRHIGRPYIDRAGRGQPLTVCNGVTGPAVEAGRWYTPAQCYALERRYYLHAEAEAARQLDHWPAYDPFTQAAFLDFIYNKGPGALAGSTMRRLANAGDLAGACRQNERWNKGTVDGVLRVLPGLQTRAEANAEICATWRIEEGQP